MDVCDDLSVEEGLFPQPLPAHVQGLPCENHGGICGFELCMLLRYLVEIT